MNIDRTRSCCGVGELTYLNSVRGGEAKLKEIYERRVGGGSKYPFYFWADKTKGGFAKELADAIKKYNLGTVLKTASKKNPNSNNNITVYMWEVKPILLARWYSSYTAPKRATVAKTVASGGVGGRGGNTGGGGGGGNRF